MVNRRRSTGFFLILCSVSMLLACGGSSTSNQDVDSGGSTPAGETEVGENSNTDINPDIAPVKIMAIGDSITQADSERQSYRYPLWKKLVDTGVAFDMVGSMQDNFKGNPKWPDYNSLPFDQDHEGHWGWRVDEVLVEIDGWLNKNSPNIVLIHLGTNDVFQGNSVSSTLDELTDLISKFRTNNAAVNILLAEVIPSKFHNTKLDELNVGIANLASQLTSSESPIFLVDTGLGFDPEVDTFDGVHPDESGEVKMADIWFEGLMNTVLFQ